MSEWLIERVSAQTPAALEEARSLFAEYHEWLGEVVCSQRLAEEIATLPGPYAPPAGRLLLARAREGAPAAGIVGVRPFEGLACEMKRLYVAPHSRGSGLGRVLAEEAIAAARDLGYTEVRLTTLPATMRPALALYESLGFAVTGPFTDHSHVHEDVPMLYMRLSLVSGR